jgi:ubiquinone/menaquinone biosynthesis C-methylase UbiE
MPPSTDDRRDWAQEASTYDAEHSSVVSSAFENELRSWLARQLTDADNALELGCGTGIFSAMIADRVKHLTATDFTPEMLDHARRRLSPHENVELRSEDACQTSFADNSFTAVLAVNLLHHAHAPADVVHETRRLLTPGGRFVVIDCAGHGTSPLSSIWKSFKGLFSLEPPPEEHHHFSPDDLGALITAGGLAIQETTSLKQRRPPLAYTCICATKPE